MLVEVVTVWQDVTKFGRSVPFPVVIPRQDVSCSAFQCHI